MSLRVIEFQKQQMLDQHALILQLSPNVTREDYERMLPDMLSRGYRMVGVMEGSKCIGLSGFWTGTKLYSDKYLEIDNFVVDAGSRSKGVGKILVSWMEEEARRMGCRTIMLDAYVENFSGHKFYYREGYIARGFHFLKKL